MAASIVQRGVPVVWGCTGFVASGIVIAATDLTQSVDFEPTAEMKRIDDGNGDWVGAMIFNQGQKYDITVIPSSTTKALAKTKFATYVPIPGTVVTVTDGDLATSAVPFLLVTAKGTRTNKGEAAVQMTIERGIANDVTAATT